LKREGEKGGKKIQQKFLFKTEEDIDGSTTVQNKSPDSSLIQTA